ncbi:outer membrane assembly protein BamC [Psychromonas sp. B3M02]|uniref:outer membrane protein assembly factor BamC n=1 Tax=unclassified Psychromonas TaxID=2614957 RepID=UPI000DEA2DF2|nr:outer membrane protein assembly factor BamC [Psychromonas sp. B3M02]RBW45714.1 outer membrane assembly protein BamC [Psychromonas sp. B3M02]
MNKNKALTQLASVVILTSVVAGCARFETRTQASGEFDYQDVELINKYDHGDVPQVEQRTVFDIKPLTAEQTALGLEGKDVDVRPPAQLMAVLDGVILDSSKTETKVWFNTFKQNNDHTKKVVDLALEYLAYKNATPNIQSQSPVIIDSGLVTSERTYGSLSKSTVLEEGEYQLTIETAPDNHSVSLVVDAQSYQEKNDDYQVQNTLQGRAKRNVEIRFINEMLQFANLKQQIEAKQVADNRPLPIKLGFDDNHQTAWIVDAEFLETWAKLPSLLSTMSFKLVDSDKNLGYFLVRFVEQDEEYWQENMLNPITLEGGEYFVQLGELVGGDTSITWLDEDKKPLTNQQVTELYLSITDNVRNVILDKESQTKPL